MKKKREGSGTCTAMVCGVVGGSCDVSTTFCPRDTVCIDGICTIQTVGSKCDNDGYCYTSEEDLVCDSDSNTCIKRKGKGETCKGNVCEIGLFCATESMDMEAGICTPSPKKLGDKCTSYGGIYSCPDDLKCLLGVCGTVPNTTGADCDPLNYGCSGEYLYCSSETNKCTEYPKDGEPCYQNYYCNEGHYCTYNNEGSRVCKKYLGKGENCTEGKCADELYCKYYSYYNKTCLKQSSENESCKYDSECAEGLWCNYSYKVGSGVCVKPSGENEPCTSDYSCAEGLWCNYSYGAGSSVCVKALGENEPCKYNSNCAEGLYCKYSYGAASRICTKYPGEGEECYNRYKCAEGLYCNYSDVCVKLPGFGEKCDGYWYCAEGLVCGWTTNKEYTCWNKVGKEGEYCSVYNGVTCEEGLRCDTRRNVCFNGECVYDDDCKYTANTTTTNTIVHLIKPPLVLHFIFQRFWRQGVH